MSEKIKTHHLERKAILYIRQSSAYQVSNNLESQKLPYAMQARLRQLGWREVEIVDDDLGRSAAGTVPRAGFERMVTAVCLGQVGAVAAREVSRFARNSREWQKLVEVCRVVDTLLIDQEMVYTPRQSKDRLLVGWKGSLNEYEPRSGCGVAVLLEQHLDDLSAFINRPVDVAQRPATLTYVSSTDQHEPTRCRCAFAAS